MSTPVPVIIHHENDLQHFIVQDAATAIKEFIQGDREVALVAYAPKDKERIEVALQQDAPQLFTWINDMLKPGITKYPTNLTAAHLRDPATFPDWHKSVTANKTPKRKALPRFKTAGAGGGGTGYWCSNAADVIAQTKVVKSAFQIIYGNKWKLHPEEMQMNVKHNNNTNPMCSFTNGIEVRTSVSDKDVFSYWAGSSNDMSVHSKIMELIQNKHDEDNQRKKRPNTKLKSSWKAELFAPLGRRLVRLVWDSSKYVLFVRKNVLQQTDRSIPWTRVNLCPFTRKYDKQLPLDNFKTEYRRYFPEEYFAGNFTYIETARLGYDRFKPGVYGCSLQGMKYSLLTSQSKSWNKYIKAEYFAQKTKQKYYKTGDFVFKYPAAKQTVPARQPTLEIQYRRMLNDNAKIPARVSGIKFKLPVEFKNNPPSPNVNMNEHKDYRAKYEEAVEKHTGENERYTNTEGLYVFGFLDPGLYNALNQYPAIMIDDNGKVHVI